MGYDISWRSPVEEELAGFRNMDIPAVIAVSSYTHSPGTGTGQYIFLVSSKSLSRDRIVICTSPSLYQAYVIETVLFSQILTVTVGQDWHPISPDAPVESDDA